MEISNEQNVLDIPIDLNQTEILEEYQKREVTEQKNLIKQILEMENVYPGGLKEYISRAKKLLLDSRNNVNPFSQYRPIVPEGEHIDFKTEEFDKLEEIGLQELAYTGFVLVAGGLGERLGYDDIKLSIPTEMITRKCYINLYCDYLIAYQDRLNEGRSEKVVLPLCIMTSDDTHSRTVKLLQDNNNFNLLPDQITIVKQEKVPAILNNDGRLALLRDAFLLETKPHGHGDVHTLLHQYKVVENWSKLGKKW